MEPQENQMQMPCPKITPKDFFLHIGVIASLYFSAVVFIQLVFAIINTVIEDPLEIYYFADESSLRFAIAALIIGFPLFIFLSWLLHNEEVKNPAKQRFPLRKWLIYLTLFIAGATIAIDLIVLINSFLAGDLSARFILKVITVLAVALVVFGYFYHELKREPENRKGIRILGGIVSLVVLAFVIWGVVLAGSPFQARLERFDQQKVNDLQLIQSHVIDYWINTESLPENLTQVEDAVRGVRIPTDIQTGANYQYNALGELSFELCALFNTASTETESLMEFPRPIGGVFIENEFWTHDEGEVCFERTINPERFEGRTGLKF